MSGVAKARQVGAAAGGGAAGGSQQQGQMSLEEEFQELAYAPVDVTAQVSFKAYLEPNEFNLETKRPLMVMDQPGLVVTVGTVRAVNDLVMAVLNNGDNCQGLVVQDVHPKIAAWMHFTTMLLRVSDDIEEFNRFGNVADAARGNPQITGEQLVEELEKRVVALSDKLEGSLMPEYARTFYQRHFDAFAEVYFNVNLSWREKGSLIDYFKDSQAFEILKTKATAGQIITVCQDLSNLKWLGSRHVAILDISNIMSWHPFYLEMAQTTSFRLVGTGSYRKEVLERGDEYLQVNWGLDARLCEKLDVVKKVLDLLKNSAVVRKRNQENKDQNLMSGTDGILVDCAIAVVNAEKDFEGKEERALPVGSFIATLELLDRYRELFLVNTTEVSDPIDLCTIPSSSEVNSIAVADLLNVLAPEKLSFLLAQSARYPKLFARVFQDCKNRLKDDVKEAFRQAL